MKNLLNIKSVSKELNVSKDTIKNMIKNNEIFYENRSGQFFVDIEEIRTVLNNSKNKKNNHSDFLLDFRNSFLTSGCNEFVNNVKNDKLLLSTIGRIYNIKEVNPLTLWLLSMETPEVREYYNCKYCNNVHMNIHPLSDMIDVYVMINKNDDNYKKLYLESSKYDYSKYLDNNGNRKIDFIEEHARELNRLYSISR